MSYASLDDLVAAFGQAEVDQLLDRDGSGVHDPGVLEAALADADAEIDGYLVGRYALPLSPVPRLIVRIACDITRYRLWSVNASEEVRRRYEDARRLLEALRQGAVQIGAPAPAPTDPLAVSYTMAVAAQRPRDWVML